MYFGFNDFSVKLEFTLNIKFVAILAADVVHCNSDVIQHNTM